jgi:putative aldouronate transport system permease protein
VAVTQTESSAEVTTEVAGKGGRAAAPTSAATRLSLGQRIRRDKVMLLLAIPGLFYFVIFHYVPLLGYVVAFQNYKPFLGFTGSPFVGFDNFAYIIGDPSFWQALVNTLEITFLQLIFFFPAPIALALLLNSMLHEPIKRFVQSVVYLPHFIGWVIIVSIAHSVLGGNGPVASIAQSLGFDFNLMNSETAFPFLMTAELIWKNAGWGTIIYLAALSGIPQELYEAAAVDGANRWRRLWHITLPGCCRSPCCC